MWIECRANLVNHSFAIGYVYSFVAGGVFYWGFNKFFPHQESLLDHPETGEEIIAEQDARNIEQMKAERAVHKRNIFTRAFQV